MTFADRIRVFGLVVESELPLASTEPYRGGSATDVRIEVADAAYFRVHAPVVEPAPADWVTHVVCRDGRVYLKAENVFEAIVAADGRTVTCRTLGETDARSVEANLLNFALSTCLTLRGEEPLHSTAVEIGGRAIGLLGRSGAGKSTLAAFLIGRGARLVTDDMLRLRFDDNDGVFAFAGPCRLKLFAEPAQRYLPSSVAEGHFNPLSGKLMVRPPSQQAVPPEAPALAALVHLEPPGEASSNGEPTLERLRGAALARTLIASAMDDHNAEPQRLQRQLAFVSRIATTIPVFSLRYRREFKVMPKVADTIERLP